MTAAMNDLRKFDSNNSRAEQEEAKGAKKIIYCKKCLMPNSRPRIVFDDKNVCNACRNAESKQEIDWEARKKEFFDLVEPYRSKDGSWDCVVPWSGGKDSSAIAYRLKFDLGMNPLLVTFSPMIPNEVGNHNREEMIKLGFDHMFFRPDQSVARKLARRFFIERGNPKVAWDAGVNVIPVKVAVKFKIPLVFYAEHGESEYGGKVLKEESKKIRDYTEVIEHQIGDDPRNWADDEIDLKDLNGYVFPDLKEIAQVGVKAMYFSYFFRWSMFENYQLIKSKFDFHLNPKGRTDGTFTNFDSLDDKIDNLYYYMQFIKFGFGRTVRDASRLIQNGHMSRREALELARRYDAEFPYECFRDNLEYLGMTEEEFHNIVDMHRNPEIWKKESNEWLLRYPLPLE
ncbi:MAG: N-acetyl sugar amidotransferase [Smithellaceae bacterium]